MTWSVSVSLLLVVLLVVPTDAIKQRWAPRHTLETLKSISRRPVAEVEAQSVAANASKAVVTGKANTAVDALPFTSFDVDFENCEGPSCFPFSAEENYRWGLKGVGEVPNDYYAHNFKNGSIKVEFEHWFKLGGYGKAVNVTMNYGNAWLSISISSCKLKFETSEDVSCCSVSLDTNCEYIFWAKITTNDEGDGYKIKYEIRKARNGCVVKCGSKCLDSNSVSLDESAAIDYDLGSCSRVYRMSLQYDHHCPCEYNGGGIDATPPVAVTGRRGRKALVEESWKNLASDPNEDEAEIDAREAAKIAEEQGEAILAM